MCCTCAERVSVDRGHLKVEWILTVLSLHEAQRGIPVRRSNSTPTCFLEDDPWHRARTYSGFISAQRRWQGWPPLRALTARQFEQMAIHTGSGLNLHASILAWAQSGTMESECASRDACISSLTMAASSAGVGMGSLAKRIPLGSCTASRISLP